MLDVFASKAVLRTLERLLLVAVVAILAASAPTVSRAGGECFSDWSEARPIVRKEGLTSAQELPDLARGKVEGDLIKITLCEEGGRYVYRLVFFDAGGNVKNMTVDARNPFPN